MQNCIKLEFLSVHFQTNHRDDRNKKIVNKEATKEGCVISTKIHSRILGVGGMGKDLGLEIIHIKVVISSS